MKVHKVQNLDGGRVSRHDVWVQAGNGLRSLEAQLKVLVEMREYARGSDVPKEKDRLRQALELVREEIAEVLDD